MICIDLNEATLLIPGGALRGRVVVRSGCVSNHGDFSPNVPVHNKDQRNTHQMLHCINAW